MINAKIETYAPDKARYTIEDLTFDELLAIYDALATELKLFDLKVNYAASKADISFIQLHEKLVKKYQTARAKTHEAFSKPQQEENKNK